MEKVHDNIETSGVFRNGKVQEFWINFMYFSGTTRNITETETFVVRQVNYASPYLRNHVNTSKTKKRGRRNRNANQIKSNQIKSNQKQKQKQKQKQSQRRDGKYLQNMKTSTALMCATLLVAVAFCAEAKKNTEWEKDPKHCKSPATHRDTKTHKDTHTHTHTHTSMYHVESSHRPMTNWCKTMN